MLKVDENPPVIYPENTSISNFSGSWWVAHTRSRNEKSLAWQLCRKEVPYFLPMFWKVSSRKRRTFRSLLPLFPGYVFFCGLEKERLEALKTNRIANLIEVPDPERLVRELTPIEILLREGSEIEPHDYIKVGQRCRVIAGPLMGTEGIVTETPKGHRLVLQVEILGQATSVEIAKDIIELIDN